jgi:hypothetical protein
MKPEEARKWAEIYSAIAEGKKWQIQSSAGEWNDATNGVHDPRGWSIERLRIKPEPQKVYVATWFDRDGKVSVQASSNASSLESWTGHRPGFRIDVIERELP